jgi:hypothetical protein
MPIPKGTCAPKSIRSITSKYGRARILVCCPRGKWGGKRCRVGMRSVEVKALDGMRRCKPFTMKALAKGARIEHREHPEFARSTARRIARDHLCANPRAYSKEK